MNIPILVYTAELGIQMEIFVNVPALYVASVSASSILSNQD